MTDEDRQDEDDLSSESSPPAKGEDLANSEQDWRFPSGKWVGFFTQTHVMPGRHQMELILRFQKQAIQGEGRDMVGQFVVKGQYELESGKCRWIKTYVGRHSVFYQGYAEEKGIWGTWEIPGLTTVKGGFHIWPEFLGDPTQNRLKEEAEEPIALWQDAPDGALEELTVGSGSR